MLWQLIAAAKLPECTEDMATKSFYVIYYPEKQEVTLRKIGRTVTIHEIGQQINSTEVNMSFIIRLIIVVKMLILFSDASYARIVDNYFVPPDSIRDISTVAELEPLLHSDNTQIKLWGIIMLGKIGKEEDIIRLYEFYNSETPQLVYGTDGPVPLIKYFSLKSIGDIGGPQAESLVIDISERYNSVGTPESLQIFSCLCDVLGKIASTRTLAKLESYYNSEQLNWLARVYALTNIYTVNLKQERIKSANDSIDYLIQPLSTNFSEDCRNKEHFIITKAVEAVIVRINSLNIIDALTSKINDIPDSVVYKQYLESLRNGMLYEISK